MQVFDYNNRDNLTVPGLEMVLVRITEGESIEDSAVSLFQAAQLSS